MADSDNINIHLNDCFKKFDQCFNRIKYFSCIMDNLTAEMLPSEWAIKSKSGLSYSMKDPDDEQYLVEGCKHFMQRYLVRDCIESFALCLDELFFVLLIHGKQTLYDTLSDAEKELLVKFQNAGIFGKVEKLETQFNLRLPTKHKQVITSLKDIRNCFAHSNGVVRDRDGKKDGKQSRKFLWTTMSIFCMGTETGERYELELNKPFKESVNVCMEIHQNFKSFKKGSDLSFSSTETYEIAWSLQLAATEYLKNIGDLLSIKMNKN